MDDDWILYWVTLFTFAVIFGFSYIRYIYTFFERNKLPGATHPTFPFGNMYDVIFQRTPMFMQLWKFYCRFKRKKYSLGGFYVLLKPAVLIVDPPATLLSPNNDYFVNDTKCNSFTDEVSDNLLCNIFTEVSKIWSRLLSEFEEKQQDVNLSHLMTRRFVDITAQQLFHLEITQQEIFHSLERKNIFSVCQTLISLCYPTYNHFFKKYDTFEKFHLILEDVVQNKQNVGKKDDFLQILIQNGVSREEMKEFIYLMLYNLKRSNNSVLFALNELCINKNIQEKLREEINKFRNITLEGTYSSLDKLGYLEAVVCETLRKYPLDPFFYKICKRDFLEKNITLTKGVLVFISAFGIHHDAENYDNPDLFNPNRFFQGNKKHITSTKYLPFGCENQNEFDVHFVKIMMKMALMELLSTFKFSLSEKSPETIQFDETLFKSLKFREDLWLKMHKV